MTRRPGRGATLALEAEPEPVVVELRVAFHDRKKWSATWRSAHRFVASLKVAGTHACDVQHPVAPPRGRYRVTLVPWGPAGEKGQVLQLGGVVR